MVNGSKVPGKPASDKEITPENEKTVCPFAILRHFSKKKN